MKLNLFRLASPAGRHFVSGLCAISAVVSALLAAVPARGDAMLELFQQTWPEVTARMPEMAEAGYDSLWLPNPAKGNSGAYSTGYDVFDPFDLGSTNQQGTVATMYGTQAQLLQMMQTAHRFGIRVYFDNVMNHRSGTVPGYPGSGTATNYYPGLIPQDFHLQQVSGGYENWDNVSDWCTIENVENNPLLGLCDIANEPGSSNWNFGANYGGVITKPVYIRFPNRPDLYMDINGPFLGAGTGQAGWPSPPNGNGPLNGWRPFDGHGQPVPEDASTYLCRAVAWTLYMTGCDGFRLDAVKHVPVNFFGNDTGQTDDPNFTGYTGAIQAMYDYVHGYGTNVTGNGYIETDGNRNSLFNTEAARNDAMIFGEYEASALPQTEDYWEYLNSGMRLINFPMFNEFFNIMNNADSSPGLYGLDGRDYAPSTSEQGNCDSNGNYSVAQGANMMQDQDGTAYGYTYANMALADAYFFMHEGLPMVYSDGFNHNYSGGTPVVTTNNYLGEYNDNTQPETMYLHNQLARGGTTSRWSDQNLVMFERYDYREGTNTEPQTQVVSLFGMNDKTSYPGDITFDDGISRTSDGYYLNPNNTTSTAVSNSRGQGLAVSFAPGSVLVQMSSSSPTGGRAYQKLLVHEATSSWAAASNSASASNPSDRMIYVGGQTITSGGGSIELTIPSDSWVIYAYQWPEASRANLHTNAIVFHQGGNPVPQIPVYRVDGPDAPTNYDPIFPFRNRGTVDPFGNTVYYPGEGSVSNLTYAIDVPVVTNANFDIIVRSDASCSNTLVKLDGGIDLNSQMGLGPTTIQPGIAPTNFLDLRDNKPGYADDVFLGYEQAAFQFRDNPEKFAAKNTLSNTIVSLGAETYYYTVGITNTTIVSGSGYGQSVDQTASFIYHDPAAVVTAVNNSQATQRVPYTPASNQSATIYVKIGYTNDINECCLYYTTDGSNPEGAFGVGQGTTQVVPATFVAQDSSVNTIEWWEATVPAQPNGTQVRYKAGTFWGGSTGGANGAPVSDSDSTGAKYYGVTQFAITNFNPTTAVVWTHNDLNPANTTVGLQSGFHIVRARTFLPRTGEASVYNTFSQTFYYDGALPTGVIAYPAGNSSITSGSYTVVVRADSTVTGVDFNIQDGNANNDDINTGQANGNGNNTNGAAIYVPATQVTPNPTLSATYTNYPQEFRFVYTNVPNSGTATITVRLKEYATSIYTNRLTLLSASVNTEAPLQVVEISAPATNGTILPYSTNTTYLISACFSPSLTSANTNFNLFINGMLQPPPNYILRPVQPSGACSGMKEFFYNWSNPSVGTNVIQVIYTNASPVISDTRSIIVTPPLTISELGGNNNQLVIWNSAPGVNYQVLATTNLLVPFEPISSIVPSQGTTTTYYDSDTNAEPQKYYQIEMVQ